jgi:3-methyladenine DNA glycosylase/8-oxoguanine DNA glycosylase
MTSTITLNTPSHFRFWPTVMSHGWCVLPPFALDEPSRILTRLHRLHAGAVVKLTLYENQPGALVVEIEGLAVQPAPEHKTEIEAVITHCLNLDRDLADLYRLLGTFPRYHWIEAVGAGRFLASPTVWEDLVKTLFTTNTTWTVTKQMTARFVTLGEPYSGGGHAFPAPEHVAALNPDDLNAHVRAGYRSAYLHELALSIAEGRIDVESWRDPALTSADLYRHIKKLKGFGDYAAGNMLRLLGHFDRLATDTECRAVYRESINGGAAAANDREIDAYYEPFGLWRGLVQWMDVMESALRAVP